jgi:YidC/Oxa1 family membrane protein insertase
MSAWLFFVELLRASIFGLSHLLGGSLGGAILVFSLVVRIALLPLTIRWARRAAEHARRMRELEPELARIRRRFAGDSAGLAEATLALYRRHGLGLMPNGALNSVLVQLPINAGLYQAIVGGVRKAGSFLWIRDLAKPDVLLATMAALLAAGAAAISGTNNTMARNAAIVSGAITFLLAWRLSAGLGLYWVASNAIGVVQAIVTRPSKSVAHA